jgi:hypothetical protein
MAVATLVWFLLTALVAWKSIRASSVASLSSPSSNGNCYFESPNNRVQRDVLKSGRASAFVATVANQLSNTRY